MDKFLSYADRTYMGASGIYCLDSVVDLFHFDADPDPDSRIHFSDN